MEAVNVVSSTKNQMTLHTSSGCSMDVKRKETGKAIHSSCVNSTNANAGCGVHGHSESYGAGFNAAGGGVMAMELRSAGIRIWQFGRGAIPSDISSGSPDPSTWSEAAADFPNTDCDIDSHFKNQSIVVNIDLCGDWAGEQKLYDIDCRSSFRSSQDSFILTRKKGPGTCTDFVANNATAFKDAYWEFNHFTVYQASST